MKYVLLSFFIIVQGYILAQDQVFKKDNTKIEAKVLEITPTEIKYKLFNYQDGPLFIVNKSDVVLIIYQNGTHEVFNAPSAIPTNTVSVSSVDNSSAVTYQNFGDQKRKDKEEEKRKKDELMQKKMDDLLTGKNLILFNGFELLNGGIGLGYMRELTKSHISIYIPLAFGFAKPIFSDASFSNTLYDDKATNYQIKHKAIEAGISVQFHTNRNKRPVSHFIGPMVNFIQFNGTIDDNITYYNSGNEPVKIVERGFVLNTMSIMVNNGLLVRINQHFNLMANIALGVRSMQYVANSPYKYTANSSYFYSLGGINNKSFNAFKLGFHLCYRF